MVTVAIICEYNPFHKGHLEQLCYVREKFGECGIVCIMSGNTVQRGEFAIFDKYDRAKTAIRNGADLVLELPFPYSCSSASQFARAGVYLAEKLCADYLCFGSESGDLDKLASISQKLSDNDFDRLLGEKIANQSERRKSFIEIRNEAYLEKHGENLPDKGNDMLGVEYLKAIKELGANIKPFVMHRKSDFSATKARQAILSGDRQKKEHYLTEDCICDISMGFKGIEQFILAHLSLMKKREGGNGIDNSLIEQAQKSDTFEQFEAGLPTKSYTKARLKRELLSLIFDISDTDKNILPKYTVLLAVTEKGRNHISGLKKKSNFPIITKKSDKKKLDDAGKAQLEKSEAVERIYSMTFKTKKRAVEPSLKKPFIV